MKPSVQNVSQDIIYTTLGAIELAREAFWDAFQEIEAKMLPKNQISPPNASGYFNIAFSSLQDSIEQIETSIGYLEEQIQTFIQTIQLEASPYSQQLDKMIAQLNRLIPGLDFSPIEKKLEQLIHFTGQSLNSSAKEIKDLLFQIRSGNLNQDSEILFANVQSRFNQSFYNIYDTVFNFPYHFHGILSATIEDSFNMLKPVIDLIKNQFNEPNNSDIRPPQ